MLQTPRIDFVSPPFAGHLFPILDLAQSLRDQGMAQLRFLSTADAASAIGLCGFEHVTLIPGKENRVNAIANTNHRVGSNPLRLYRQFRINMSLMVDLRDQLRQLWQTRRPDLVIADFTVPIAGLLSQDMGIPWWTSMPSPCAIETRTGTPSHMGGWTPRGDWFGRTRDAGGRLVVRTFKRVMRFLFAGQLRALSVSGPYRADGTEIVYSPERILALGMREFEFERDWPPALEFIGPLTGAPPFPFTAPEFVAGKKHILISLGTHLNWVKQRAAKLIKTIAPQMPDCVFHFTFGQPGSLAHERPANLHFHGYIPYDQFLDNYDAAIIHGGTGVLYSCIKAGVPMLVWPQDFDHFDHAARIVSRRLGFRLRPRPGELISDLRAILNDDAIQSSVRHFQLLANDYDAGKWALHALKDLRQ